MEFTPRAEPRPLTPTKFWLCKQKISRVCTCVRNIKSAVLILVVAIQGSGLLIKRKLYDITSVNPVDQVLRIPYRAWPIEYSSTLITVAPGYSGTFWSAVPLWCIWEATRSSYSLSVYQSRLIHVLYHGAKGDPGFGQSRFVILNCYKSCVLW
jgi:hypothetical protein